MKGEYEDDLAQIRRMLKEVGGGIKRNSADLVGIKKSFTNLNKDLKKVGMGMDDRIFDEMDNILLVAGSKNPYTIKTSVNENWNEMDYEDNTEFSAKVMKVKKK